MAGCTLYDKLWNAHLVKQRDDGTSLIYIDRQLVHEVTSPQAFEGLRLAGREQNQGQGRAEHERHELAVEDELVRELGHEHARQHAREQLNRDQAEQDPELERSERERPAA